MIPPRNDCVRVLLTGFGRFPGAPANPSATIVRAIAQRGRRRLERAGIDLVPAILPVIFEAVGGELDRLIASARPDALLQLGLAGRRRALTVETRARNRRFLLHPDAAKRTPSDARVIRGGEPERRVRLPAVRLVIAMCCAHGPAKLSQDAGFYVCNATLYLALGTSIPQVGFIHVPPPRRSDRPLSQTRQKPPRPSLATMIGAIEAALLVIAAEARRARLARRGVGNENMSPQS